MKYLITYCVEGIAREVWADDYNTAWEIAMLLEGAKMVDRVVIQERKSGFHLIYETKHVPEMILSGDDH